MPNKTKTDVQNKYILLDSNNKKTALMLKVYYVLAILCNHVSSYRLTERSSHVR